MALETTFQIPEVPVPRNEDIKRKVIPLKTNHIPKTLLFPNVYKRLP